MSPRSPPPPPPPLPPSPLPCHRHCTKMTSIANSTSTRSPPFPKPTSTFSCKSKTQLSFPLTFSNPQHHPYYPYSCFTLSCTAHTSPLSSPPPPPDSHNSSTKAIPALITKALILLAFSLVLLSLRLVSDLLLPEFPSRWNHLIAFSSEAEAKLFNHHYPHHLLQAIVAYEDRRFFRHFGVDPVGVARAVFSLSRRGGGSTITQQLVKNAFLKNERTFLRKIAEMVLALALERTISKLRILSTYMSKIYWGNGIYGIESASSFYFGKHPSLLSLGECALLGGMIPAPELRSPFRNSGRGKIFQARVLRRMVEVGFIDVKTALHVVRQPLHLNPHGPDYVEGFSVILSREVPGLFTTLKGGAYSDVKNIWDWEGESKVWEVKEDMEKWAMSLLERNKIREVKLPQSDTDVDKKSICLVTDGRETTIFPNLEPHGHTGDRRGE